jgi:hypothetical protein
MTGAPELKRADRRNQDVKHKRSWTNNGRCYSEQRHDCDVTRRTCVAHRRVKKSDHPDGEKKRNEMRCVHLMMLSESPRHREDSDQMTKSE